MRAIGLSIALALALTAQVTSRFNGEIAAMASALAEHNAEDFLSHFDRRLPGLDELKANVRALIDQASVHSGIDEITEDGDQVVVDWIMDLTSRTNSDEKEHRQAIVRLKFDQSGKHPKVVAVEPAGFFGPPRFGR
jgi:hypothetical protein